MRFSPLHEGDTSVAAQTLRCEGVYMNRFSPLHEGDTSVALLLRVLGGGGPGVSVPFTRGTPPWLSGAA